MSKAGMQVSMHPHSGDIRITLDGVTIIPSGRQIHDAHEVFTKWLKANTWATPAKLATLEYSSETGWTWTPRDQPVGSFSTATCDTMEEAITDLRVRGYTLIGDYKPAPPPDPRRDAHVWYDSGYNRWYWCLPNGAGPIPFGFASRDDAVRDLEREGYTAPLPPEPL